MNRTAKVSNPCSNSTPSRANPRRQLQQGSEGLKYGMSNQLMQSNASNDYRHATGHRGFSDREISDGMFV